MSQLPRFATTLYAISSSSVSSRGQNDQAFGSARQLFPTKHDKDRTVWHRIQWTLWLVPAIVCLRFACDILAELIDWGFHSSLTEYRLIVHRLTVHCSQLSHTKPTRTHFRPGSGGSELCSDIGLLLTNCVADTSCYTLLQCWSLHLGGPTGKREVKIDRLNLLMLSVEERSFVRFRQFSNPAAVPK